MVFPWGFLQADGGARIPEPLGAEVLKTRDCNNNFDDVFFFFFLGGGGVFLVLFGLVCLF